VTRSALAIGGALLLGFGILWTFVPEIRWCGAQSVGLLGTPLVPTEDANHDALAVAWIGVVLLTQWLFLRPRGSWKPREGDGGRPMRAAAWGAAFCAMLLTAGAIAALLEIPDLWEPVVYGNGFLSPFVYGGMVALWAIWAWIFAAYAKSRRGILRGLVKGTFLELFVAVPVHAACWKRDDCYCARGSYTALVFGGTALLWVFGPGIFLLYRSQRAKSGLSGG